MRRPRPEWAYMVTPAGRSAVERSDYAGLPRLSVKLLQAIAAAPHGASAAELAPVIGARSYRLQNKLTGAVKCRAWVWVYTCVRPLRECGYAMRIDRRAEVARRRIARVVTRHRGAMRAAARSLGLSTGKLAGLVKRFELWPLVNLARAAAAQERVQAQRDAKLLRGVQR